VKLFHHANIGGYFLLTLESGRCNNSQLPITPRASHAAIGNRVEQHIQPIRNKEQVINIFWLALDRGEEIRDRKVKV
jgi:hypothetical protein